MRVLIVLLLALAAWGGYRQFVAPGPAALSAPPNVAPHSAPARPVPMPAQRFTCDGRQHCSQMRSCEEATFFIRHCPNTKMDGDNDGVPCESQWCG